MDVSNCFDSLNFYNNRVLYENVEAVADIKFDSVVYKRHRNLRGDGQPVLLQFVE